MAEDYVEKLNKFGDPYCPTRLTTASRFDHELINRINDMLVENDKMLQREWSIDDVAWAEEQKDDYFELSYDDEPFGMSLDYSNMANGQAVVLENSSIGFENFTKTWENHGEVRNFELPSLPVTIPDEDLNKICTEGIEVATFKNDPKVKTTGIFVEGDIILFAPPRRTARPYNYLIPGSVEYFAPYISLYCNDVEVQRFQVPAETTEENNMIPGGRISVNATTGANDCLKILNVGFYADNVEESPDGLKFSIKIDHFDCPVRDGMVFGIDCDHDKETYNYGKIDHQTYTFEQLREKIDAANSRYTAGVVEDFNAFNTGNWKPIDRSVLGCYDYRAFTDYKVKGQRLRVTRFGEISK